MSPRATLMFKSKFVMVCNLDRMDIKSKDPSMTLIATSNDPWGPTGAEMSEIAQMTFNG